MQEEWRRIAMGKRGDFWEVALQKKNRIIWVNMPYPEKRYYSAPELKHKIKTYPQEVKKWIAKNGKS
jgi:hypothetical protein